LIFASRRMSDLLADTNLLVYAFDENSQFYTSARNLLYGSNHELFTTSKNLCEFLAVVTRAKSPVVPISKALEMLEEIENKFVLLYPSPESSRIFRELLRKYQPVGLRIHDFEIIAIGLSYQINLIGTADGKDFSTVTEIQIAAI
ncbi:MAG: PIN domain-containing protein, partial [Verrucomicrobiota bacterium]|nr:PIN domain-containing protein [Verrucomicrobiota bacterium]